METTILAVVTCGFGIVIWQNLMAERLLREILTKLVVISTAVQSAHLLTVETRDVLREASRIKAAKAESVFEKPPVEHLGATRRYVPLALRRRQAEIESLGPVSHADKVRENNARAMESA